jgi:L,D-peptidoglycan transpeptidase YkuD (ErfK/YbiS/YcfS/YnhG family)
MRLVALVAFASLLVSQAAFSQGCPEPLASTRRLVLVTADNFTTSAATLQRYERDGAQWRANGGPVSALIGLKGMAWSQSFRSLAAKGDPVKYEGDKRIPAGFFGIGRSFGFSASRKPNYMQIRDGMVCVSDALSPAYNTITTRAEVGQKVHAENMWRIPDYRNGIVIDYPTDAKLRAGSCIFIHVALPGKTGTSGCVALPEPDVVALQDFASPGAVIAVLPRSALPRLSGCLPAS